MDDLDPFGEHQALKVKEVVYFMKQPIIIICFNG